MSDYEDMGQDRAHGYDDEEEDDEDQDQRTTLFRQAEDEIKQKKGNFVKREDLNAFIRTYQEVVGQPFEDQTGSTLLHRIVEVIQSDRISASNIKPLVSHIVNNYPRVLCCPNDKGQNPLYLALAYKKWVTAKNMVDGCSNAKDLQDAIAEPCKEQNAKTSLHLALEKDGRPQTIEMLIQKATYEALGKKDTTGKTPLHYAVDYAQCSDARADIIDLFIKRDEQLVAELKEKNPNKPVHTFMDETDQYQRSVFQHHRETRDSYVPPKVSGAGDEESKKQAGTGRVEAGRQQEGVRRADLESSDRLRDPKSLAAREREPRPRPRPGETGRQGEERSRDAERGNRGARQQEDEALDERKKRLWALREQKALELTEGRDVQDGHREGMGKRKGSLYEPLPSIMTSDHGRAEPSPKSPLKKAATWRPGIEEAKKKPEKPDSKILARNSERILTALKLHYMRTRSTERATTFLYGKNVEGIQICFEYHGLPAVVKEVVFIKSFGADWKSGIQFDKILRYVSFPVVMVKRTPKRNAPKDDGAVGRRDMQFFFEWLYKKACIIYQPYPSPGTLRILIYTYDMHIIILGVRHIIRVNVDDTSSPAHTDESIQASLKNIVVEQLNWCKVDLDPSTICQVGIWLETEPDKFKEAQSQLTEVKLRWGGNNAVLRAWSELEGLPLLPHLSKVLLYPVATEIYDSQQWIDKKVDEFKLRLEKNIRTVKAALQSSEAAGKGETETTGETKTVEVKPTEEPTVAIKDIAPRNHVDVIHVREATGKSQNGLVNSRNNAEPTSTSAQVGTSHQWLDCIDQFAKNINGFWNDTLESFLESRDERARETSEGVEKDIVVALIDDGVDSCDDDLAGHILDGKTFDYDGESMKPHFVSDKGHGTVMASMIARVCPMAKIYSIRLKTRDGADGKSQIVVESAALAIQAALDKGANIISMSWTVPVPEENSKEMTLLTDALESAVKSQTLMFCSSPDRGEFKTLHYPTAYNPERFFRIGAAKDTGAAFDRAGPIDSLDFILPGVDVVRNHSTPRLCDKVKKIRSDTGSSVATALAAGLAATIIYCVKACALAILTSSANGGDENGSLKAIRPGDAKRIAEHTKMKRAFERLGTPTEKRFIPIWDSLEGVNKTFESEALMPNEKLESLINLAKSLMPIR
ncbi:hypothetical protein L207DRAFT_641753 [Hyaloscypha variabilis F]|uniref:Peptidase S8/S53 domain-containing protein n=1 Tax=Hyaloscypha variabilis (strain UAMH 11265 / GT02V1 / F) TaxID=1149755 RepID=A0A2J6QV67_HYAVF|nr:hypothetical protein L207DRAFT_641753 [Hyaloscypha variabilis F]